MDEYVIAPPRKESLPDYNDDIEPVLDPELWNSITQFGYLENPKQVIYIANHLATQPSKQSYLEANDLASFLKYLNVGGILNTSISRVPTDQILDFYENNDIIYRQELISDDIDNGFHDNYLEKCLNLFLDMPSDKAIIIHCSQGVNRSAAAAAGILWAMSKKPRKWDTPEEMIDWMRTAQNSQRGRRLLKNKVFEQQVIDWCYQFDDHPKISDNDVNNFEKIEYKFI